MDQHGCLFWTGRSASLANNNEEDVAIVGTGSVPMDIAGRLNVVMAYAAFALVGAIVLGLI